MLAYLILGMSGESAVMSTRLQDSMVSIGFYFLIGSVSYS